MNKSLIKKQNGNFANTVLGAVYRLIIVVGIPFYMAYMLLPPLWLLGIPYYILTGRELMKDWCKVYGV